jgi:hypothetical protein
MLVAQRVNKFIVDHLPDAVCDRCICEAMHFNSHAHAAQITGALGTTSDFDRRRGECALCKNERVVIRAIKA